MVLRRLSQVSTSDDDGGPKPSSSDGADEDDVAAVPTRRRRSRGRPRNVEPLPKRRKRVHIPDDDDDDDEDGDDGGRKLGRRLKGDDDFEEEEEPEEEEEEEESVPEDAKPIGEAIRVSGKGRGFKKHFKEFEFDGNRFELEDPVLLTPEDKKQKPYVAIIKDITQSRDGSMMVTGQWFYRPEEAEKNKGGSWQARDTRELFYSFHRDDVPAESVMHKCVVHFVPLSKQLPSRKQYPGFIVQKVYDTVEKKLWKLTDKDYEDGKQEEIDVMVQKTISRLGELPDIESEDILGQLEEPIRSKRLLKKRHISSLDVSREDEGALKSPRVETPGSCLDKPTIYTGILADANALTKESQRDKWLEKLLQAVEYICSPAGNVLEENKGGSVANGNKQPNGNSGLTWPDSAVSAIIALEKASHDAFSSDYSKYNQKLRSLLFNLKNTELLAQRLLNGELEPSKILSMQPNELKEGLTQEEIARNQPEESAKMQMTDARCKRCNEKKVGVVDIIQAGHGDRYQLECIACGNTWYASRDEAATLTIDGPSVVTNVGTAPLATAKFESVEKKKVFSPRDSEKTDAAKKNPEAPMPVLDAQTSFTKRSEDANIEKKKMADAPV
ncbi:hypothetical protein RND81_08G115300 [Saponaria officinalis]|uniref:Uncharacterized protein n=1 Tax=Saponaria officinalis TaxID=3572 RepID=A0AAW1J6A3_SAPOF